MGLQLQIACAPDIDTPTPGQFESWAAAALAKAALHNGQRAGGELTIRVVDRPEMADLNRRYRRRAGPTNVLAFPFEGAEEVPVDILGDVVICAPLVVAQAARGRIPAMHHWAHLVVHGVLHLCGFDHQREPAARRMEAMERDILAEFHIALAGAPALQPP
ncbi:MAG: rRNA maturation RNase YbeY [Gammaproteobacteria bacterium]|nr:rRNA maturation RNase YbeY [Gammaproteobacteria bacterium]